MFITGGGGSSLNPWSNFMGDGPVNYLQTPSTCKYVSDSFIVITPWVDENLLRPCNSNDPNYVAYFPPLFAHLLSTFRIDPARIQLDGYCFGGAVWYKYAALYPKMPASMSIWSVGNSGSCVDSTKACVLAGIPIQWWQDDGDSFAPYQASKAISDAIKKCGGTKINYYLCNGGWHEIWRYGSMYNGAPISDKTPAVYSWMLQQINPSPTALVNSDRRQSNRSMKAAAMSYSHDGSIEVFSLSGKNVSKNAGVAGKYRGAIASKVYFVKQGNRVVRLTATTR
jgi:hypothetical protein